MKTLFIVLDSDGTYLYRCHNILELFRLRDIFGGSVVYRYSEFLRNKYANKPTNKRFKWDSGSLTWNEGTGLEFELITYESLEVNYQIVKNL